MAFWIFMVIMDLLIPAVMIGFGRSFMKQAPKEINSTYGYRTSMAMKNRATWEYAHKYCGKLWYYSGLILLPLTVLPMLFVIGKTEDMVGTAGGIICIVQMIPFLGVIPLTEIALRRTFDKNGIIRNR